MLWLIIDLAVLVVMCIPSRLIKASDVPMIQTWLVPLQMIFDDHLYKTQHDGRKIYLEKVLNDWFEVPTYDNQNHELSKTVYIENVPRLKKNFIYQPNEDKPVFLADSEAENENFIYSEDETRLSYSWTINIPDSYVYDEVKLRAVVDEYRFIGKLYTIKTYTLE